MGESAASTDLASERKASALLASRIIAARHHTSDKPDIPPTGGRYKAMAKSAGVAMWANPTAARVRAVATRAYGSAASRNRGRLDSRDVKAGKTA